MAELDEIKRAFNAAGGDSAIFVNREIAHLAASGHNLLSRREIHGVRMNAQETPGGISACVIVERDARIKNPVHLCFGVLREVGIQKIKIDLKMEEHAVAAFIAHCFFPSAKEVQHSMDAVMEIGHGAQMDYIEGHYHGPFGGASVFPKAGVKVGPYGRYFSDFSLTTGRVGTLAIDYRIEADDYAVAQTTARVFGHVNDKINITEQVVLAGRASRGLVKIRAAMEDEACAEVIGMTEGRAEGARGHVDCMEIVKDRAVATAIPSVKVTHPLAKVTHEAAIGSVDKKQLETLMAHGLSPEQAVNMIVSGLLR